MTEGVGLEKDG